MELCQVHRITLCFRRKSIFQFYFLTTGNWYFNYLFLFRIHFLFYCEQQIFMVRTRNKGTTEFFFNSIKLNYESRDISKYGFTE